MSAFSDLKSLRRLAVNKLCAELDGPRVKVRIDPAANTIACFENNHAESCTAQFSRGCETGRACSDNQNICVFIHELRTITDIHREQDLKFLKNPVILL